MDINFISIIGFTAGTLTTVSFFPQVIKTFKTRETKDLSLSMYIILAIGIFLWALYGILTKDIPIALANSVSFTLAATVLVLKIKHG